MADTTILTLPLIAASQAQKHVTHNEALGILDVILQLVVADRTLTAPPGSPVLGDRHIVGPSATGDWTGHDGEIALYNGTLWIFYAALAGWRAHVLAEGQTAVFDGTDWLAPSDGPFEVGQLGVNATPDVTNRLSVASPATLLNHVGAGHQVKINKATAGDTASLLYQTGFSGRAEMGLAGNDNFTIKVSDDGTTWLDAVVIDASTGRVSFPQSDFGVAVKTGNYATVSDDFLGNLLIEMDVASANTLTVSPGMANGEPVAVAQKGAGQTTVVAGAGVTLLSAGGALKLRLQNSVCTIMKVGTNTYRVTGDLVT